MARRGERSDGDEGGQYSIRAVDRVCDLIEALRSSPDGLPLTSLAARVAIPKSSVLRYLSALESRRFVERDDSGVFRLGVALRTDLRAYTDELRRIAGPHLEAIRDQFDETTNLGILDGDEVLHVLVCESQQRVRLAAHAGERAPLYTTAMGKAAATLMPTEQVVKVLRSTRMVPVTPTTITTEAGFLAAVAAAKRDGYAIDDLENQADGRCVAVPLPGLATPAAVSVSAPSYRFPIEQAREVGAALSHAVRELVRQAAEISA